MSWTPGRPAAPLPAAAERKIVTFVKAARSARLIERSHPLGRELVCLMAGELLWSRVFRPSDGEAFDADVDAAILAFVAKG